MNAPAKPGPRHTHLESTEVQAVLKQLNDTEDRLSAMVDAVQRGLSYANQQIRDIEDIVKTIAQSDASLTNQLTQLRGEIAGHDVRLDAHLQIHRGLHERLEALETGAKKPGEKTDHLVNDIYEFLQKLPGMKVTPGFLVKNLVSEELEAYANDANANSAIRIRLNNLAKASKIKVLKEDGRNPVYWYEESEGE